MRAPRPRGRWFVAAGALALLAAIGGAALMAGPWGQGGVARATSAAPTEAATPSASWTAEPTILPTDTPAPTPTPTEPGPTLKPIDVFATPTPRPARGALPTDQVDMPAPRRPIPVQSAEWLRLKAAGRIALVQGKVVVLDADADPLVNPYTHLRVREARTLETGYARWIVEPYAHGTDQKGNRYANHNYWNLCEPGATAAALYYWQLQTGHPDVTGTAGYFLDPYASEGVPWPVPGPTVAISGGKRIGTYWSGTDTVDGFIAHGRGYIMYLGMAVQPPGWKSKGMPVYADAKGRPYYPTIGAPRTSIQAALNWEASGNDTAGWTEYWYASVMRFEPTLAVDLRMAVMLDVGRDSVPVVVELDTHALPNWQNGAATRHVRHAVAIVGYDNTASPPTYTYIDTCGTACNHVGGNRSGQIHVIAQSQMVQAIQERVGSGFLW